MLKRALPELVFHSTVFALSLFAFSTMFYLTLGPSMDAFWTPTASFVSLSRALFGDFDIESIMEHSPDYSNAMLFLAYLFFAYFILVSMFLAILGEAQANLREDQRVAREKAAAAFEKAEPEYGVLADAYRLGGKMLAQAPLIGPLIRKAAERERAEAAEGVPLADLAPTDRIEGRQLEMQERLDQVFEFLHDHQPPNDAVGGMHDDTGGEEEGAPGAAAPGAAAVTAAARRASMGGRLSRFERPLYYRASTAETIPASAASPAAPPCTCTCTCTCTPPGSIADGAAQEDGAAREETLLQVLELLKQVAASSQARQKPRIGTRSRDKSRPPPPPPPPHRQASVGSHLQAEVAELQVSVEGSSPSHIEDPDDDPDGGDAADPLVALQVQPGPRGRGGAEDAQSVQWSQQDEERREMLAA